MISFSSCRYLLANAKNSGVGRPLTKVHHKYPMQRPICQSCHQRSCAVNYIKQDVTHYRSKCENCTRKGRGLRPRDPRWKSAGYKKKPACDKCGFKSAHSEVFAVFHVDGDLNNCRPNNLKTVCANCQRVLHKEGIRWRQGDLVPDL
jgi:hypothetical protein